MTGADFKKDDFVITQGTLQNYNSSAEVVRSFCGTCGSHICYTHTQFPDNVEVFVGAFDKPDAFPTQLHTWTSKKPSWVHICDDLPQHEED